MTWPMELTGRGRELVRILPERTLPDVRTAAGQQISLSTPANPACDQRAPVGFSPGPLQFWASADPDWTPLVVQYNYRIRRLRLSRLLLGQESCHR